MSLSVNKLSKRYSSVWALKDLSFEVEGGSVIGLFGASGSGKTTLLRIIAGRIKPSSGTVVLADRDLTQVKAKERGITYHSGQTESGFRQLFGRFVDKTSTGEAKLEGFKAALAASEKVLLLDDPFTQMDVALLEECFAEIRKAGKMRGRIIIFASSDFDQIARIADEAAFISRGELVQHGTPKDFYEEPLTLEAAMLTGDNNLISARRVSSTDAELPEFHTLDGGHRLFAQNVAKAKLGPINQNLTLAIRPEQIVMSLGSSPPEENFLKGVVKAIKFRGATSVIEFDAGGLTIRTIVLRSTTLEIGDECMLGLPPHRVLILKS
jgi:ABC-type Fe3+/spermidine/putrescine transport system ATPase subunit